MTRTDKKSGMPPRARLAGLTTDLENRARRWLLTLVWRKKLTGKNGHMIPIPVPSALRVDQLCVLTPNQLSAPYLPSLLAKFLLSEIFKFNLNRSPRKKTLINFPYLP